VSWDPSLYERFEAERAQPFFDLLALCAPLSGGTAVDLGCGTGRLTAGLHRALGASATTGIDSSPEMLARAPRDVPGLAFAEGDLAAWRGPAVDLVFANASLHWVGDHPALLGRLRRGVRPGGQLAFGVPANFAHPSHVLAREVAAEPAFAAAGPVEDRGAAVLAPERYAELLDGLGAAELHVRLQVYGHRLASTEAVVDWVAGTALTPYRARLDPAAYEGFVARYRRRLLEELGDRRPYFYAFPRILCWARFDSS
jgi:trans-aconitate 2-methyltransferase